jgi:sugar O-acyltransferase (sialic acid O-acetyltransferase NeuD family)
MNKKPIVIFGTAELAQLAHFYFTEYSDSEIVGFTIDSEYIGTTTSFCGLPIVPFEDVLKYFPAEDNDMFIALGYSKLNLIRREKYFAAKELGYCLASYVSPNASVFNDLNIGENCFIFEDNTIQPFVTIGNNVTLWSGNHIGHHSVIKDHCFIASHAVISGGVEIGEQCFVGVNATLRDHISVGDKCVIGAGALLLSDAEAEGVYLGSETQRARVPSTRLRNI